jgi:hypothetical protein
MMKCMNLESYLEKRIEELGGEFLFLGIPIKDIPPKVLIETLKADCIQCLGSERAASYLAGILLEDWNVCSPKFNLGGIPVKRPNNLTKKEFVNGICKFFYATMSKLEEDYSSQFEE